ncbi:nSTAND1 domain-containing NTPase [Pseudorhodoferax sp.]|uniref:nSTAND1 domain-containing NTPase n=1 Tax=Pseudorhodoferax sp. TaxID=1993553 RepID=UPI002DD62935|nr:transcriptional regulator [Pseudorhodoferax sp.]
MDAADDGGLRVHMSLLRKALGTPPADAGCSEWIANIPLRGYQFLGKVRAMSAPAGRAQVQPGFMPAPHRSGRLVGRDTELRRLAVLLRSRRLVTVVGPGGMGKTSIALHAAALHCAPAAGHRVPVADLAFVDFAPLDSAAHVLGTVAHAVHARGEALDTREAIVQALARRPVLLLLDNCEHVIEPLALLVQALLAALPQLHILATSREPLAVDSENVLWLPALHIRPEPPSSLAEAARSPAVELLIERLAGTAVVLTDAHSELLPAICRQVDGIPLAIELVAAQLAAQPVERLRAQLGDHLRLYAAGSALAHPRHQTLAATLDWSLALLDAGELLLFRRLSLFRGRFDAESAMGIAVDVLGPDDAFEALLALTRRSLVAFDGGRAAAPYRLLDTTRAYAHAKLQASGERPGAVLQHARLMCDVVDSATADLARLDPHRWAERYPHRLDDVRAALQACIAQHEDTGLAAQLAIASAPLWFRMSLVEEYRDRVLATLAYLQTLEQPAPLPQAWLQLSLYNALWHTGGSVAEMVAACETALAAALAHGVVTLEFQARWGLCALNITRGDYTGAFRHARIVHAAAESSGDPAARNLSHRMHALVRHFCGDFAGSRDHALAASQVDGSVRRGRGNIFQPDARITARAILARTQWIAGQAAQSMATARETVAEAEAEGHALTLCIALFWICPVAVWSGERDAAQSWTERMLQETNARGLRYWHQWAVCYAQALPLHEPAGRAAHIERVLRDMDRFDAPCKEMLVTFCEDWLDTETIARAGRGEGQWSAAEVARALGRRHARQGDQGRALACCTQALETARAQGAGAWEQRAAEDLVRLQAAAITSNDTP